MHNIQFHAQCTPNFLIGLAPCHYFIGSDVKSFANGIIAPEQTEKSYREICVPWENPQGGAITRENEFLPLLLEREYTIFDDSDEAEIDLFFDMLKRISRNLDRSPEQEL